MVNGTADPLMPFMGGGVGFAGRRGQVLGALQTAELFAQAQGCAAKTTRPLPDRDRTDGTNVIVSSWSACAGGTELHLFAIQGGGHQVAGAHTFLPMLLGRGNHDISAATEILSAFKGL
jgi:polyhydroxybutyrate depolymerase